MSQLAFYEYRQKLIDTTLSKREVYRKILDNHLLQTYNHPVLKPLDIQHLSGINLLLSSSRGGSSVVVDVLKQQAQSTTGNGKTILSIPGEQRPYIELAKLTPPIKTILSDKLGKEDATYQKKTIILTEIASEIGYPLSQTTDIKGYAITIYGRLLLQWPSIDLGDPEDTISKIEKAIKQNSQNIMGILTYVDDESSCINLMSHIQLFFPQIDLRFYDKLNVRTDIHSKVEDIQYDSFIEEPPFILPQPWHHSTTQELTLGVLLLKDPSDAWRVPFWKEIFDNIPLSYIHLVRNPSEVINGLCDGWKFPFGYFTSRSPQAFNIVGYTTNNQLWTQWYTNYSTSDGVWETISKNQSIDLEHISALQWADAHNSILNNVDHNIKRIHFEQFRTKPIDILTDLCNSFGFELTPTLFLAATNLSLRKVQVTPGTNIQPERWRESSNFDKIVQYTNTNEITELSRVLGYFNN